MSGSFGSSTAAAGAEGDGLTDSSLACSDVVGVLSLASLDPPHAAMASSATMPVISAAIALRVCIAVPPILVRQTFVSASFDELKFPRVGEERVELAQPRKHRRFEAVQAETPATQVVLVVSSSMVLRVVL
jgi:hypothetical protein